MLYRNECTADPSGIYDLSHFFGAVLSSLALSLLTASGWLGVGSGELGLLFHDLHHEAISRFFKPSQR